MQFPAPRAALPFPTPALLRERGVGLRAADSRDLPFLAALYASTRADEMATVPWPETAKRAFLDSQFGLQHRHYVQQYPDAHFLIALHQGSPFGRYYLNHGQRDDLVVDIALSPEWCGRGVGTALLAATVEAAAAHGRGVELHVLHANVPARRLYERLSFRVAGDTGSHLYMRTDGPA